MIGVYITNLVATLIPVMFMMVVLGVFYALLTGIAKRVYIIDRHAGKKVVEAVLSVLRCRTPLIVAGVGVALFVCSLFLPIPQLVVAILLWVLNGYIMVYIYRVYTRIKRVLT